MLYNIIFPSHVARIATQHHGHGDREPGTPATIQHVRQWLMNGAQGPHRSSGLRPPSKIQPPSKLQMPSSPSRNGLSELADAATNSRGAMGPPLGALKHKPTGRKGSSRLDPFRLLTLEVPEPPLKRASLTERAGHNAKTLAAPNNRPVTTAVKRTAASGLRGLASSAYAGHHANTSKQAGLGGGVGYNNKVSTASTNTRPKSSYGHSRSKSHIQQSRPATAMAEREMEQEPQRKGAYPFLISTNPSDSLNNFLGQQKLHTGSRKVSAPIVHRRAFSETSSGSPRSHSLSTLPTSPVHEERADTDCEELSDGLGALSLGFPPVETRSRIGRGRTSDKDSGLSFPNQLSTSIPRASPAPQSAFPTFKTPKKRRQKPQSPSKRTPFLNRFTNDTAPVFDTEDRINTMERQFLEFKQKMEGEASQASDLKDTIKVLQSRGRSSSSRN